MYNYYFSFQNFDGEKFTRLKVIDKELSDAEVQKELSGIFSDYDNIESAILEKVTAHPE